MATFPSKRRQRFGVRELSLAASGRSRRELRQFLKRRYQRRPPATCRRRRPSPSCLDLGPTRRVNFERHSVPWWEENSFQTKDPSQLRGLSKTRRRGPNTQAMLLRPPRSQNGSGAGRFPPSVALGGPFSAGCGIHSLHGSPQRNSLQTSARTREGRADPRMMPVEYPRRGL